MMPRSCCARVLDALCCCFRDRHGNARYMGYSSSGAGGGGGLGKHDMSLNMILHGECGVGKTSLRNRWVDGVFTGDVAPTYGVDFNIKTLDLVHEVEEEKEEEEEGGQEGGGGEEEWVGQGAAASSQRAGRGRRASSSPRAELQVKINVYDTSGKAGYREVNSTYLLAFDAVLFVYDVSAMSSLTELRRYFSDPAHREKLAAKRKAGAAMLLVGNKSDVPLSQRQVGSQTGEDTAAEFGLPFLEVSAKSGSNVREAFMSIATRAVGEHLVRKQSGKRRTRNAVKRTVESVPGLQRVLKARASVLDLFRGMTTRRSYSRKNQATAAPAAGGSGPGSGSTEPGGGGSSATTPYERSRRYKNHRISEVEVGSSSSWRRGSSYGQQQQQPSPTVSDGGGGGGGGGGVSSQGGSFFSHGHFHEHRSVDPLSPSVSSSSQGGGGGGGVGGGGGGGEGRGLLSPTAVGFSTSGGGGSGRGEDAQTARLLERYQERRPPSSAVTGSPPRSAEEEERRRLLPLPAATTTTTETDQQTSATTTTTATNNPGGTTTGIPPPASASTTTEAILAAAAAALPTWIRPVTSSSSSSQQPRRQHRKGKGAGGAGVGGEGNSGSGTPSSSGSRASLLSSGQQSAALTPTLSPTTAVGAGGARSPSAFSPRGQATSMPGLILDGGKPAAAAALTGGVGGLAVVTPGERSLFAGGGVGGGGRGVSSRGGLSPRAGAGGVGGAVAPGGVSSPRQPLFDDTPRSLSISANPERGGGGGGGGPVSVLEDNSASRRLKETSSFWLDKWGIKESKTDSTRGRHSRVRTGVSTPPSPRRTSSSPKRHSSPKQHGRSMNL